MKSPHWTLRTLPVAACLLLAACETEPDRKAMMEEIRHSVPTMTAHQSFFDGGISARLLLGGNAHDILILQAGDHSDARNEQKMMGGLGANVLGSHMGESNFGGSTNIKAGGDTPAYGDEGKRADGTDPRYLAEVQNVSKEGEGTGKDTTHIYQGNPNSPFAHDNREYSQGTRPRVHETEMPPAALHLALQNHSQATMVVEIREVNSDLGNFAVRPDHVTLEPGETKEVEPMQSLLGLESYELPVRIELRAAGVTEAKTLTLRPSKEEAPATHSAPSR